MASVWYKRFAFLPTIQKFVFVLYKEDFAIGCDVRCRALASHTDRRFDSRGGDCLLLFANCKLRSIYKSCKAQLFGIHFN